MIIEIDLTVMINEGIMGYQEEEIYHSILDSPLLQFLSMNASGIELRLMFSKKLILIKPPITPKQIQKKDTDLERQWKEGKKNDEEYQTVKRVLEEEIIQFLAVLKLKILILEYLIDKDDEVNFKERK